MAMPIGSGLMRLLGHTGRWTTHAAGGIGRMTLFFADSLRTTAGLFRRRRLVEEIHFIGNRSLTIITLSSAFTGMVLSLQGYDTLVRFGSEQMLGALVSLSLVRELGPVLGALMVTARAGSAMAATLGNMRVTEQIDALRSLGIDPVRYLVAPRLLAAVVTIPMLIAGFCLVGIAAAGALGVLALHIDGILFVRRVQEAVEWKDVWSCLLKSLVFSLLVVGIATYRGYHARGGARGVGLATTRAVVETAVAILVGDYALTSLVFQT